MPSTSEVGHQKNVASFESLIASCIGFGAKYNPVKTALKIPAQQTQLAAAEAVLVTTDKKVTAFNNVVNARIIQFADIKTFTTQLLNALIATDATDKTVSNAKTINHKIQGSRAKLVPVPSAKSAPATDGAAEPTAAKTISASQQSYDSLVDHFTAFREVLAAEPSYGPNEAELKLTAVDAYIIKLNQKNTDVINAEKILGNTRISRNEILYNPKTGIIEIASQVKAYVLSVFKANSPQFKQVDKIPFKTLLPKS